MSIPASVFDAAGTAAGAGVGAGRASSLAGWQAIDAGKLPAASKYYERATGAAREADDKSLLAYAAGEQAYVLADLGENEDALAVIRAAHDETRTAIPHQIKTWLYAAEGELAAAADRNCPAGAHSTWPPRRSSTDPTMRTFPTSR